MDEQIQQIIDAITAVAPEVWRIMLQQARVEGALAAFWSLLGLTVGGVSLFRLPRTIQRMSYAGRMYMVTHGEEESHWDTEHTRLMCETFFLAGAIVVFGLLAIVNIDTAFRALLNPEYYAIRIMLGLVK